AAVGALLGALTWGGRRWAGAAPALAPLAAGLLALDPTASLYSRFGFSYNALAPLISVFVLGLWGYAETRARRWLALAAALIGLGLLIDLWAGALLGPLIGLALWRRPRDLAWSLPLAAAPFTLYLGGLWLSAPAAALFDLRFTLLRLNAIPLAQQVATLTDNAGQVALANPAFALGGLGLLGLRPAGLRAAAALTFFLPLALLGRTVALYSLSAYYLIPLYPLAALGLATLSLRLWEAAGQRAPLRAGLSVAALFTAVMLLALNLVPWRDGFTTPIDDFLVAAADARAAAGFVNAHAAPDDLVLASPAVAWQLTGRAADFQMAAAAAGQATPHLPADLPAARWVFDPRFERARYLVVDNLWRNWAVVHVPAVDAWWRAMDNWPIVFQTGAITIYAHPTTNP
nr:hypothetical protein [Anaerolineales bacterium]